MDGRLRSDGDIGTGQNSAYRPLSRVIRLLHAGRTPRAAMQRPAEFARHGSPGESFAVSSGNSPRQGTRPRQLFLVSTPHGGRRAGVADRPRLVHGPERERMVEAAEQAGHLDDPALRARRDGHVPHTAAANAPRSWNRCPLCRVDRFKGQGSSSSDWAAGDTSPPVAYGPSRRYLNPTLVPLRRGDSAMLAARRPR